MNTDQKPNEALQYLKPISKGVYEISSDNELKPNPFYTREKDKKRTSRKKSKAARKKNRK